MNFKVAPEPMQKLRLLGDSMRFEPAGTEPRSEDNRPRSEDNGPRREEFPKTRSGAPKSLPCISQVSTPTGKKPVLKAMMTTACERNCFYCPFRAGRTKTQRVTFTPDEMATTFNIIQKAGHVDGLFLSSGIIKGSVATQDQIIATAEILRRRYRYRGYIHLKIMPGAEYDQIRRAMQLANRVSVNLEGATEQRLQALAPKKDFWQELVQRLQWISRLRSEEGLRASAVTQFVVGAVGDTDLELLQTSDALYHHLGLKRTYFSSFHPLEQTPFEHLPPSSDLREFRLYQASFLLRDYGWQVEDLPFQADTNLRLDMDPKLAWAQANLRDAPVEINRAGRDELLRVPGIGPKLADVIVQARTQGTLTELAHLARLGVRDVQKTGEFVLLNGRQPAQQLALFAV